MSKNWCEECVHRTREKTEYPCNTGCEYNHYKYFQEETITPDDKIHQYINRVIEEIREKKLSADNEKIFVSIVNAVKVLLLAEENKKEIAESLITQAAPILARWTILGEPADYEGMEGEAWPAMFFHLVHWNYYSVPYVKTERYAYYEKGYIGENFFKELKSRGFYYPKDITGNPYIKINGNYIRVKAEAVGYVKIKSESYIGARWH